MTSLIIDAANEKILLKIIVKNESYTNEYSNSRENFDKLSLIIFDFLKKKRIKLDNLSFIFVNLGPGKTSSIRTAIAISKAICISNDIKLYGFKSRDINKKNYNKILDLLKKGALIKNLIKPIYI